ncbi:hypothetical protein [Agrobacterium tumefaciens]|uniref:hypothetical protein n=1 Tax=Agrobacterium tumefaciens TaxID=358 RepID=UPI001573E448|nr:DUF3883 domain-containing protein [Agrobacterium tumefaciens]NTD09264.1 DUF3883 domain-containing protein [Agrobacterium tumefaciens]
MAVTSARSALDLMGHTQLIGRNPIFDFGAWDPADKARLAACWQRLKRDWSNVPIVPDADGVSWCSLREAWIWDDKEYRQFRVSKLVKAGVLKIASPNLGTNRLPRFRQLTTILGRQSSPPREILAAWTAALAQRLFDEKAGARSWASFYADISRALKTTDDLGALKNVSFLIGRGDKLFKPAAAQGEMPVFVRPTETQKRDRARAPLPPSIFARQFAIFNDDVVLKPDVLERFLRAGLLKRYDPVDIIQGIGSVLSKPSPARLEAAIVWAFNIWRAEPARLSKVLSTVGLLVEARKGWLAPNLVHFSDGWTPLGKKVDMYLAEGAVLSDDCRHASERLLVAEPAWVSRTTATRSDWINFLRVLGVQDSLPLLSDDARSEGRPDWHWGSFLREEKPAIGRDRNWILSNPNSTLPNPQTNYQRQGELLRIPGQVEYEQLHADARERLADLILAKITDTDTAWQHFKLGRYDRHIADRNEREFTTPAWSFILGAAWVPVNADDGSTSFMRLDDLWHSSDGRQKAPRFLIRPEESVVGDRLIPLLACFVGVDRAHAIMAQLVGGPARGAIANILEPLASTLPVPVGEFLDIALGRTELAQVRKLFDVGFRELNEVLTQLGKPTLSNEAELRRLFEVWKEELRPGTIDRLRRHFMANYRTGASLTPYVGLKALNFLHFQMHWIAEFEELDRGTVKALLDFELEGRIGPDSAGEVPDFKTVIEGNRRKLRHFVEAASPVVKAWCFSKQSPSALWNAGVLEVLKAVEATGLLDFEQIQKGGETAVLKRASIWPAGMPGNLEAAKADTQQAAVDASIEAHARHREALAKARRTVRIAGTDFDTADVDLSVQLTAFADKMMADNAWLARSKKRIRLQELPAKAPRNAFGGSGGGGRRTEGIPEDAKRTMGFISEYLASKYLVDKHGARFSDASWVSGNRGYALTDGHGDDTEGFDFRVRTKDVEWRYEVKSGLADNFEFEFTQNEMRSALECGNDRTRRYRILYVPFVFDPSKWKVVELPNPMQPDNSRLFQTIGKGSTRMKFLLE